MPTVRSFVAPLNFGPVSSGMITPAARMNTIVIIPSTVSITQKSVRARCSASSLRSFCSRSVNTGTNAADRTALANRFATRLGTR